MGYTNRNEIPEKYKWNLADIYPTVDKWEEEFKVAEKSIEKIAKFKGTLNNVKKQAQTPQMVRGMEISTLSVEHLQKDKAEKLQLNHKLNRIAAGGIAVYLLFFALLYPMLAPIEKNIQAMGLGIQAIVTTFLMLGINSALHLLEPKFPLLQNKALTQMLQVYAFICILIVLVSLNNLPEGIFSLAL